MRISRKETIANIPILKIRDFFDYLCKYNIETITLEIACEYLKIDETKANSLLKKLLEEEYIEMSSDNYKITLKGSALRNARCVYPINREKTDKIVADLMLRIEEININDYYLYRVSKILLFGSYINKEAVDFGDIDIAFELEKKIKDSEAFEKLNRQFVKKAKDRGKRFSSFIDEMFYSRHVVLLKLKNRNRYISLHEMEDGILEITETIQIYPVS